MDRSDAIKRFLHEIEGKLDKGQVLLDKEARATYDHDYTEDFHFLADVVVIPNDVREVQTVVKACNQLEIPLTVRGAGTGLSGGSLAIHGGITLSMERFNQILDIDERNFQATVEPGVINEVFQQAVAEKGLFYPPDPASKGSCYLGGDIAHNSGGPRALKYGVTKDYVLNLEVVTAAGEVIWTGANTLKNSTGYNLTQLMIGSEGTLGIVTKIVFKLLTLPKTNLLLLASFPNAEQACASVAATFRAGGNPSALEFMERNGVEIAARRLDVAFEFKPGIDAYLLIEVDGPNEEALFEQAELINRVMEEHQAEEVLIAQSAEEKERLWKIRRAIGETVKAESIYKEEDTVVPRAELPRLLKGVKRIGKNYGFESVCYGHAGDGNLHINIIKGSMSEDDWNNKLTEGIREIFELCRALKGTISGEHGIGYVQKNYMDIMFSTYQLDIMRAIKKALDPKGILNPGKIFPDAE